MKAVLAWIAAMLGAAIGIALIVGVFILGLTGLKAWGRSQARANANNQVALTSIRIRRELQQVKVVQADNGVVNAQAHQRYLESVGVRDAQDEIAKTLTPYYLQYEQIKAEQAVATSGRNNTVVYIPSGAGGVPLVTANAGSGK